MNVMDGGTAETVRELRARLGALDGGQSAARLDTAAGRAVAAGAGGADELLPVDPALADVLPWSGLRRGSVVSVAGGPGAAGSVSLMLALLARWSAGGGWTGIVGLPSIGYAAAAEMGMDLDRVAVVPRPGDQTTALQVVDILAGGMDAVMVGGLGEVPARMARRTVARLRQHRTVLVVRGAWPGADVVLRGQSLGWEGLGRGTGRLRQRRLAIEGTARSQRPRRTEVLLPGPDGRLTAIAGDVDGGGDAGGDAGGREDQAVIGADGQSAGRAALA